MVTKEDIIEEINNALHAIEEGDMTEAENFLVDLMERLED